MKKKRGGGLDEGSRRVDKWRIDGRGGWSKR